MPKSSAEKPPAHTTEDKIAFGAQLAQARKKAGFSLESAADALRKQGYAISKAAVGHWETGQNLPDALWLRRLARLYKTSSDDLLFGGTDEANLPEDLEHMVSVAAKLPPELRDQVLTTLRNVLGMAENAAAQQNTLSQTTSTENINAGQRSVKRMKAA